MKPTNMCGFQHDWKASHTFAHSVPISELLRRFPMSGLRAAAQQPTGSNHSVATCEFHDAHERRTQLDKLDIA